MKRMLALIFAIVLLVSLVGCVPEPAEPESGLRLWFTNDLSEWSADAAALTACPYEGEPTVPALMAALLAGPGETGAVSPIPAGTTLMSWSLERGILRLSLSRGYSNLVGVDLTLADYCITLTMSQLPGVDGVQITVNNGTSAWRDRPIFRADDVVFSGAEEVPVELSAPLYFQRTGSRALGYELRIFRLREDELPTEAVLAALVAGPEDSSLTRLIPEGVTVHSARVDAGVCYVDFSAQLLQTVPADEESQILILSSVVETLCGLDAVQTVQILVDGETVSQYGYVDISQPLEPSGRRP